ncbi:MAG: sugar ABC transporter substrate-binding protein, partial [Mesorhizobium sp.]
MRVGLYEKLVRAGATRRDILKGAASMAAIAAASGAGLGALTRPAAAADDLRAQILQIPGVG